VLGAVSAAAKQQKGQKQKAKKPTLIRVSYAEVMAFKRASKLRR